MDGLQEVRNCKKCLKNVQTNLITCFKCASIYHTKCLLNAPGLYMDEKGRVSCCSNVTLQCDGSKQTLDEREYSEGMVKEENVRYSDNDIENHTSGDEKVEDREYRYVAKCLEFEEEKYVINYQEQYPNTTKEVNCKAVGSVCSCCKVEISEEKSYAEHIRWCKANHFQFTEKGNVRENKKIYQCEECTYTTNSKYRLKQHSLIHSKGKLFKCTYKNCKCTRSLNLPEAKSCECGSCEYATVFERNLKKHILTKHSNQERKYKCSDCNYSTNTKQDLVRHERIHANEKLFKCDICDFASVRSTHLKSHVLRKHSDEEKKYKCGHCEYSSHDKANLIRHICIHTNEKPFKCTLCEFATIRRNHLKNHVLKKHSNEEKKYKCEHCKYCTHDRYNLLRHIRSRHSDKLYKCGACDFVTLYGTFLKKHVLATHSA